MMVALLYIAVVSFIGFHPNELLPHTPPTNQILSLERFKVADFEAASGMLHLGDRVLVSDQKTHRLYLFNPKGELINEIGGLGQGPQSFSSPSDIASSNGLKIYVSDTGNERVQILDRELNFLSQLHPNQAIDAIRSESVEIIQWQPDKLFITPSGDCMVWDLAKQAMYRFNPNGAFLGKSQSPSFISELSWIGFDGSLVQLYDASTKQMHTMSPNGLWMDSYGFDWNPYQASGLNEVILTEQSPHEWSVLETSHGSWVKSEVEDATLWVLFERALFRIPLQD